MMAEQKQDCGNDVNDNYYAAAAAADDELMMMMMRMMLTMMLMTITIIAMKIYNYIAIESKMLQNIAGNQPTHKGMNIRQCTVLYHRLTLT